MSNILERIRRGVSDFERRNGRTPNISELAEALKIPATELWHSLKNLNLDEVSEGTSAFEGTLRQMLFARTPHSKEQEICLYDENDALIGNMTLDSAFEIAKERQLRLHIVNATSRPAVVRLIRWEQLTANGDKKRRSHRRESRRYRVREICIDASDSKEEKSQNLQYAYILLKRGSIVQLTIESEVAAEDAGLLIELVKEVRDFASMDGPPDYKWSADGRAMFIISARFVPHE